MGSVNSTCCLLLHTLLILQFHFYEGSKLNFPLFFIWNLVIFQSNHRLLFTNALDLEQFVICKDILWNKTENYKNSRLQNLISYRCHDNNNNCISETDWQFQNSTAISNFLQSKHILLLNESEYKPVINLSSSCWSIINDATSFLFDDIRIIAVCSNMEETGGHCSYYIKSIRKFRKFRRRLEYSNFTSSPSLAPTFLDYDKFTINRNDQSNNGRVTTLALVVLLSFSCIVSAAWCCKFAMNDHRVRKITELSNRLPSLPRYKKGYDKSLDDTKHSELGCSLASASTVTSYAAAPLISDNSTTSINSSSHHHHQKYQQDLSLTKKGLKMASIEI